MRNRQLQAEHDRLGRIIAEIVAKHGYDDKDAQERICNLYEEQDLLHFLQEAEDLGLVHYWHSDHGEYVKKADGLWHKLIHRGQGRPPLTAGVNMNKKFVAIINWLAMASLVELLSQLVQYLLGISHWNGG